ncbi:MAG: hypothetical protein JNM40_25045 [Myxococcales bacterium]|nr:hypothetical protein [Myxococcales bacterium]
MISRAQVCRHVEHLRAWFFVAAVLGMIGFVASLMAMILLIIPYQTALGSIGLSLVLYVLAIYVGGLADSAIGASMTPIPRAQRNRNRNQVTASVVRHSLQTPSSS